MPLLNPYLAAAAASAKAKQSEASPGVGRRLKLPENLTALLDAMNDVFPAGMLAIALISAILIVWQVTIARKSLGLDHDRRRSQATLEFYRIEMEAVRESHSAIRARYALKPGVVLSPQQAQEIRNDVELQRLAINVLSSLERLAVGANRDAFDSNIIRILSASRIMGMWGTYSCYIMLARKTTERAYVELQKLVEDLAEFCESNGHKIARSYNTAQKSGYLPRAPTKTY